MSQPLINILIRISRPELFDTCIASIRKQTYQRIRVIACVDNQKMYNFVRKLQNIHTLLFVITDREPPYYWNMYCNNLKNKVTDGFFFFMDDDDYLESANAIENLSEHLTEDTQGLICQFIRRGRPKPHKAFIDQKIIKEGYIGGGCLVLHSRHKAVADWDGEVAADFRWIQKVSESVELKFVPLVVQVAGNNGLHGKPY